MKRVAQIFGFNVGSKGQVFTTIGTSKSLLTSCLDQAVKAPWYSRGLIGGEFRSKHTVMLLHIWMVHKRLLVKDLGSEGPRIQESLFDEFWDDTSDRIRQVGVPEISVNKYLSEVQGYSFKTCVELDACLAKYGGNDTTNEDDLLDSMGGVLWRSAYARRNEIEVDHVLELAKYVRENQQMVQSLSKEVIQEGVIKWGDIPWQNKEANNRGKIFHKSGSSKLFCRGFFVDNCNNTILHPFQQYSKNKTKRI